MKKALRACLQLLSPVFDLRRSWRNLIAYPRYFRDLHRYRHLAQVPATEAWSYRPILDDWTATTQFDSHYVYLGAWAFRMIAQRGPGKHVDVGSQISWCACLASIAQVVFIDIRPFTGNVPNFSSLAGSVLKMPFSDQSVPSLSCLHVVEHIGLGRYGDPLNPVGSREAIKELARILSSGGYLYFGLPVGKPQTCFNAHRVHDPAMIAQWFREEGLSLEVFSAVDDEGVFHDQCSPEDYREAEYACGMFLLTRK